MTADQARALEDLPVHPVGHRPRHAARSTGLVDTALAGAIRVGGADDLPDANIRVVANEQYRIVALEDLTGLDAGG